MPNAVGPRALWSVLVPGPNTSAEADAWTVRPAGVAFHFCPIPIPREVKTFLDVSVDEGITKYLRGDPVQIAADVAASANPDHVIMWCTSNTFWGGTESSAAFKDEFRQMVGGRSVTMGSEAAVEALKALDARRAAIISPYPLDLEPHIERYFGESGIDVVKIRSLECAAADDIVNVPKRQIIEELRLLSQLDADVIVQLGAAMSMLRLAAEAEHWLDKPVVSLSAAVMWSALRSNGFHDQFDGFGSLLRNH
jgi:maleate isomerase